MSRGKFNRLQYFYDLVPLCIFQLYYKDYDNTRDLFSSFASLGSRKLVGVHLHVFVQCRDFVEGHLA